MSIPLHCTHTRLSDPTSLQPNPVNPNLHSAHQIQLLASIIEEQGRSNPVTASYRSDLTFPGRPTTGYRPHHRLPVDEPDYARDAQPESGFSLSSHRRAAVILWR